MENQQICPACQRQNSSEATHCATCGLPLAEAASNYAFTTKGVHITPATNDAKLAGCAKLAKELPETSIGFIIVGADKPLIIHDVTAVVIGRGDDPPGVRFVNLAHYGDLVMGISRQHARVTYDEGKFWLEDMHSTNGSWLNRKRLVSGVPYPLAPNDNIWLGPMKMVVCFGSEQEKTPVRTIPVKEVAVLLQPRNEMVMPKQPLSITYLAQYVLPFMQALDDMQQALDRCRGRTAVSLHLRAMRDQNSSILFNLSAGQEIISLYQVFISPWRDQYLSSIQSGTMGDTEQTARLIELAKHLVLAAVPELQDLQQQHCIQAILPGLKVLAINQIEMSLAINEQFSTKALG